jgi:UDP-N-acetyl-D-galactosamine dehydrogenase
MDLTNSRIAVLGLGYVGLPLAVEFGKRRPTLGFDISRGRVAELKAGTDHTRECSADELAAAHHLSYSSDMADLATCGVFIVAVPTPIDKANRPDLGLVEAASRTVGQSMKRGAVVIYESTVFPGCTREICVPILEKVSGLVFNRDFYVGYSPERINPGDAQRRLPDIVKVTSGSTPEAAEAIDALYASIVTAGTYKAASIEVAEAAKVIENTQRDLNIALMNELSIIFHRLGLDTNEVLAAAGTKWNFLRFTPGLVGGHCIGVDPYYLTHRAQEMGYHPEVILAGRRVNDSMGSVVAERVAKLMLKRRLLIQGGRVLILGLAFKENCPDIRNSRVIDIINELREYGVAVDAYDPWVDAEEARAEFGLEPLPAVPAAGAYDGVIVAVAHRDFAELGAARLRGFGKDNAVFFDVKGMFDKSASDGRL